MNYSWRLYQNPDKTWDAVLLINNMEAERETFDHSADASRWVKRRLRELGAL